jgi:hypothetical protein
MAMGRPFVLEGIRQPTRFYSLNVERVTTNPQSTIRACENIRIYYFKNESGTIQRENGGDAIQTAGSRRFALRHLPSPGLLTTINFNDTTDRVKPWGLILQLHRTLPCLVIGIVH